MTPNEIQRWAHQIVGEPNAHHNTHPLAFAEECIRLRGELDALTNKYQARWEANHAQEVARNTEYERDLAVIQQGMLDGVNKALTSTTKAPYDPTTGLFGEEPGSLCLSNAPAPKWSCAGIHCPKREPVRAAEAPKCYTCDRRMTEVVAFDPPVTIQGLAEMDRMKERLAKATAIPPMLLLSAPPPVKSEPELMRLWHNARKSWAQELREFKDSKDDAAWGPSVLPEVLALLAHPMPGSSAELEMIVRAALPDGVVTRVQTQTTGPGEFVVEVAAKRILTVEEKAAVTARLDEFRPAGTMYSIRYMVAYSLREVAKSLDKNPNTATIHTVNVTGKVTF